MIDKIISMFNKYKKRNNRTKRICTCHNVTNYDIKNAINNGCNGVNDIRKITKAGTACGKCNSSVEYEVYKALKK